MQDSASIPSAGSTESAQAAPPATPPVPTRRYLLVTPCRDEAKFARRTLEAVTRQSMPPALWVIVDDGSRDETPQILREYAERFPYIRVLTRVDRGDRKLGGGVIDAFYTGYDTVNHDDFDYVCKLDLDLDLPERYFETLMQRMEQDPRIGTCSGKPYYKNAHGQLVSEKCGDENSVGMVKFYRTECFKEIGGFVRELMWDGIDCHRCRMLGWVAVSWDDPALNFEHLRPMGTSHKNWWTGRVRHGVGQYFMGTGPAYLLASALFRVAHPPVVVGATAMLWGYAKSMFQRRPRYGDTPGHVRVGAADVRVGAADGGASGAEGVSFRRFLRRYQWHCLLRGKRRATESLNARQAAVWQSRQPRKFAGTGQTSPTNQSNPTSQDNFNCPEGVRVEGVTQSLSGSNHGVASHGPAALGLAPSPAPAAKTATLPPATAAVSGPASA